MNFEEKAVLVTGASSGLGAATVRRLAALGADVYAASRDQDKLAGVAESCTGLPGRVTTGHLDVTDPNSCREAVAAAVTLHGRLDALINNAGRHDFRVTTEVTDQQWDHDIATNLGGAFHCSRAAIPHLLESGGAIVNVSSVAGQVGEAYSAA